MTLQQSLAVLLRDMDDLLVPHFEAVDTITENENARPPNIDVTVESPTQHARDYVDIIALRMDCDVEWEHIDDEQWGLVFTPKEAS